MKRIISVASSSVAATFFSAALALSALSATAHAQSATTAASGVLRPPSGVTKIVSVDAHNVLIVETEDAPDAPKQYSLIIPRHIYSGSLARLFGGSVIPAEMMVSPGMAGRGGLATPGAITPMVNYGGQNNTPFNGGYPTNGFPTTQQPYAQQPYVQQPFIR